jgi:hypothetical protein
MFSSEVSRLLAEVIGSWQVIVAAVAVILFISIVNKVARPGVQRSSKPKVVKAKKEAPIKEEKVDDSELHLEEPDDEEMV